MIGRIDNPRPRLCVAAVPNRDGWRTTYHQCSRPNGHGPDGEWCKQHNPEVAAKRKAEASRRYEEKWKAIALQLATDRSVKLAIQLIADGHNNPRALAQWALAGGKGEQP